MTNQSTPPIASPILIDKTQLTLLAIVSDHEKRMKAIEDELQKLKEKEQRIHE